MGYHTLDLVQGSQEWKAARFNYVTASNMPAVLDRSPYKTRLEYATEILTRQERAQPGKADLFERGHRAEAAAREWARDKWGGLAFTPAVVKSTRLDCLLASLDGIDEFAKWILEAKLVGQDAFAQAQAGVIPEHHAIQVQAQLLATGFDTALYVAVNAAHDMAAVQVKPDAVMQAEITERAPAFWADTLAGRLPEPGPRDTLEVPDAELARLAELHWQLKGERARLKPIEDEMEQLESVLKSRYPQAGRIHGHGVALTRYWAKGTVDFSALVANKGIPVAEVEQFRKTGSLRTRISIK